MANAVEMSTMRKLVAQLNQYRHEYYNLNAPSVADDVYDYMYDELLALEERTGVCMANSPTQTVGYPVVSALPKVAHDIPLLSLDKTKSIEDLITFQAGRTVDLSLKLDGLTTELIYENGQLIRLSTRGDGYIGENITHNAKAISGIPERIPYEDRLVVVGESFIHNSDFESLKSITDSAGNPYKNSRNLAAGSIRAFDAAICAQRHVSFLPFSVLEGFEEYTDWANGKHARLLKLTEFGFGIIHAVQLQNGDKAQYRGKKIEVFSDHEIALLAQKILEAPDITGLCILLVLNTGLRLGEICALRKSDIDYRSGFLRIERSAARVRDASGTHLVVQSPKSGSSVRLVAIPNDMLELLKATTQSIQRDNYLLTNTDTPMEPRTLQYRYRKLLERCGIRYRNFHALRHTYATRCMENGVDIKSLSELLGHADVRTTLQTYIHSSLAHKRQAVQSICFLPMEGAGSVLIPSKIPSEISAITVPPSKTGTCFVNCI